MFAGCSIPEQIARHAEVNVKQAAIQLDENLLAVAADTGDLRPAQRSDCCPPVAASNASRRERNTPNPLADDVADNGTDYSFDFGKFRQAGSE